MGIGRQVGDIFSVPNLFRNGGLDFWDASLLQPPFCTINGALKSGSSADSLWDIVLNETPDAPGAPANYFKLTIIRNEPVSIGQDFSTSPGGTLDHVTPIDPGELNLTGFYASEMNLLYQGEFTLSFAVRVPKGSVSVGFAWVGADGADNYVELDGQVGGSRWRRFSGVFSPGKKRLTVVGPRLQRRGLSQAIEAHVGNIMLAPGAYDDLPYTGDPAAAVLPKGAIVLRAGVSCPPGFMALDVGKVFPREGTGSGGASYHTHVIGQEMLPTGNWPRRSLLDSGDARGIVGVSEDSSSKADPADDHQHPIGTDTGADNTTPINRGFVLCKRI